MFICFNSLFPFASEQVRILLYRECDFTGRRLLFDSSALKKINVASSKPKAYQSNIKNQNDINANNKDDKSTLHQEFIEIWNGYGYTYNQASSDSNSIGEMIFGAVAMSFKGTSLKVRIFKIIFSVPIH